MRTRFSIMRFEVTSLQWPRPSNRVRTNLAFTRQGLREVGAKSERPREPSISSTRFAASTIALSVDAQIAAATSRWQ